MKRNLYCLMVVAGTLALASGCRTPEEIQEARKAKEERRAEARRAKEERRAEKKRAKFDQMKERADAGDGKMAYTVAKYLKDGKGVARDPKLALVYYEKASKAGVIIPAIPDTVEIWNLIGRMSEIGDLEHSSLFGDCFQKIWNTLFVPYVWKTGEYFAQSAVYGKYFNENFDATVKMCLNYLDLLEKTGKEKESYELKQRLIAIVRKKPSDTDGSRFDKSAAEFLKKLERFSTKEEERQMHNAEENLKKIKYPSEEFSHGFKMYKQITSGVSLQWFIEESLLKGGIIECKKYGNYLLTFTSTAYPNIEFTFSSSLTEPTWGSLYIDDASSYQGYAGTIDLNGVLVKTEIKLPRDLDIKAIYNKFCQDFPQIKPVYKEKENVSRVVSASQYGKYVATAKIGEYTWENDEVFVKFSFADMEVTGPSSTNEQSQLLKTFKAEAGDGARRTVLMQDKKLFKKLVTEKQDNDKAAVDAENKRKKEEAHKAALDF